MDEDKPKQPEYEKPSVIDYGHLAELTAGGVRRGAQDALWPNNEKSIKGFS